MTTEFVFLSADYATGSPIAIVEKMNQIAIASVVLREMLASPIRTDIFVRSLAITEEDVGGD